MRSFAFVCTSGLMVIRSSAVCAPLEEDLGAATRGCCSFFLRFGTRAMRFCVLSHHHWPGPNGFESVSESAPLFDTPTIIEQPAIVWIIQLLVPWFISDSGFECSSWTD